MSVADRALQLLDERRELSRSMARSAGQFVDQVLTVSKEMKPEPVLAALPPATGNQFDGCLKKDLIAIARGLKIPGRTKAIKAKGKGALIALLLEHNAPALTYQALLDFYLAATSA